ncbi:MAG: hypothetical protein AUH41_09710 [Gemmatimonadetes bacterium 13_1_40CM_66_11]|nr:MAG: hypothetical protein AUH41_09710 [Gemmatimonadetes bacterium 13_1_40CM_66_11]
MSSHPAADPGARRNGPPERHAYEQALAERGIRLPLPHRAGWSQARRRVESLWVPLRAPDGSYTGAVAADAAPTRSLPGYRHLRVERLGETLPRTVWRDAVAALAALARQEARVLLLSVEVFSRDPETRATLGALLTEAGFTRAAQPRNWGVTLALDLRPSEAELLASFSRSLRQRLTGIAKLPVAVRPVDDERFAPRLEELTRQAFQRTGGRYEARWDWAGVIALSRRSPDASRLVGLFRTDRDGTDALLGFAWDGGTARARATSQEPRRGPAICKSRSLTRWSGISSVGRSARELIGSTSAAFPPERPAPPTPSAGSPTSSASSARRRSRSLRTGHSSRAWCPPVSRRS